MNSSNQVSVKELDKMTDYKDLSMSTNIKKSSGSNKINLYQKLLERPEFRRPITKEIVLDEDEYLNCLERIIQREYFPGLYKINQEKVK